jgi:hypothetical protein
MAGRAGMRITRWLTAILLAASIGGTCLAQVISKEKETCLLVVSCSSPETEKELHSLVTSRFGPRFRFVEPSADEIGKQISISYLGGWVVEIRDAHSGKTVKIKVAAESTPSKNTEAILDCIEGVLSSHFPLQGRVVVIEGRRVTVDVGRNIGLRSGIYLDVFSGGKRVGLIELESVYEEYSEGRVLKGRGKVLEGMEVREYVRYPVAVSISQIKYAFLRIEPNPDYIGPPVGPLGQTGYLWKASVIQRRAGWGWDGGLGWASMELLRALQGDFNVFTNSALRRERLELQLGVGGGIGLSFSEQRWERTPGRYKDNQSVYSGKASPLFTTNYQAFIGLNLYLSRMLSIMGRYGYYGYGFGFSGDSWSDSKIKMPKDETFYVDHEWLEYKVRRSRGWGFEVAVILWGSKY